MSEETVVDFTQAPQMHRPQNVIAKIMRIGEEVGEPLRSAITTLVETLAMVIDGLNNNLNVELYGLGVEPKRVVYEELVPHLMHEERYGKAVENAYAELVKLHGTTGATFDVMFIEPDPTHRCVLSAWHCKDMWVKQLIGAGVKRDLRTAASHRNTVDVYFGCEVERGIATNQEATAILRDMHIVAANPHAPAVA